MSTHPYTKFNRGSAKPPLKLGHVSIIRFHTKLNIITLLCPNPIWSDLFYIRLTPQQTTPGLATQQLYPERTPSSSIQGWNKCTYEFDLFVTLYRCKQYYVYFNVHKQMWINNYIYNQFNPSDTYMYKIAMLSITVMVEKLWRLKCLPYYLMLTS